MSEQTYIFRHLQNSEHKEDVFLAVLELLVFEVAVDFAVSQGELFGQVFEVSSDIGFGFDVPLKAKASACSVYLLQQLQRREQTNKKDLIRQGHVPVVHTRKQLPQTLNLTISFDCWAENADCKKEKGTTWEERSITFILFHLLLFDLMTTDWELKDCVDFHHLKQPRIIQQLQTVINRLN